MKMALTFLILMLAAQAFADSWDAAKSKNSGNYVETYSTTITTHTATLLVDSSISIKSANIDIFNNSGYILWIGTNTSTLATTGFPILSSNTFTLDGTFTGAIYGLSDSAAGGSTNARTIYYLKNDALR